MNYFLFSAIFGRSAKFDFTNHQAAQILADILVMRPKRQHLATLVASSYSCKYMYAKNATMQRMGMVQCSQSTKILQPTLHLFCRLLTHIEVEKFVLVTLKQYISEYVIGGED